MTTKMEGIDGEDGFKEMLKILRGIMRGLQVGILTITFHLLLSTSKIYQTSLSFVKVTVESHYVLGGSIWLLFCSTEGLYWES